VRIGLGGESVPDPAQVLRQRGGDLRDLGQVIPVIQGVTDQQSASLFQQFHCARRVCAPYRRCRGIGRQPAEHRLVKIGQVTANAVAEHQQGA
jgi:hypothetical protein